ncbi:MAG: ATP-binding protein [Bryobacterales bacterium]|nr:ATP-binding protein [Bryobacterales bacterium]
MARQILTLLVGLPGSGKSTYARERGLPVVSSDDLRHLLLDDATDQTQNRRIFGLLRQVVRMRIELERPLTVLDATNLSTRERRTWIKLAQLYGAEVHAVFFDTPLEVCKQRNRARSRNVPEDVIDMMAARMRPPSIAEGFTEVMRIQPSNARVFELPATAGPE